MTSLVKTSYIDKTKSKMKSDEYCFIGCFMFANSYREFPDPNEADMHAHVMKLFYGITSPEDLIMWCMHDLLVIH